MKTQWKYDAPNPSWLEYGLNSNLDKMLSYTDLANNISIFVNFSHINISMSTFDNSRPYIAIAVSATQQEADLIKYCWNKNGETFDDTIVVNTKTDFSVIFKHAKKIILEKYNIHMDKDNTIAIINPPYDGNANLYGKITFEAIKQVKEVVVLSPILNYLENSQKKTNREIAKTIMPYLKAYERVESTFDAKFDKPLYITQWSDAINGNLNLNDTYWNKFSNPELTKSILNKCEKYSNHCYDKIIAKKDFDNYSFKVAFSGIRGNTNHSTGEKGWDWTTLLDENKMINFTLKSADKGDLMAFPFASENECKNFVSYVNQDIFEFLIYIQKNSMNTDKWLFKKIPFMPTYTKSWSEADIAKEIGLTQEEVDYIHEEMKDFGWKTRAK